jgi:hypothetical protein
MRVPPVGWAFFGLAVVVMLLYLFNRGIHVGTSVESFMYQGKPMYRKNCHYFMLNGIENVSVGLSLIREEAEAMTSHCSPLK